MFWIGLAVILLVLGTVRYDKLIFLSYAYRICNEVIFFNIICHLFT